MEYDAEVDALRSNSTMTIIFMEVVQDIEGLSVQCQAGGILSEPLIIHLEDGE